MFRAGRDNIDPCRVDATMPKNICELSNILFDAVEHTGEQMAKIMRKHFFGIHLCFKAEVFHFSPDVCAAYRLARASNKDLSRRYLLFGYIAEQFLLQITDDENTSRLAF